MNLLRRGFSLPELLVVIAIIGLITSIGYAQYNEGRKQARDDRRRVDVDQIALALRLYYEQYGEYPCEAGGCINNTMNGEIGAGGAIDALLAPYMEKVPADPLGPGHASYLYYYDGDTACGNVVAVHAITLEVPGLGNWSSVCGADTDGNPTADTYTVVVGNSSG